MKRIFDVLFSSILIVVLSPLFLILYFIVKTKLGSPVIFKQKRPGLNGKIFVFYKVRTMINKVDDKGVLLSDKDRLTGLGRFLRSNSLDELPQLWNVLIGDMSFVGPRALLVEYLPLYNRDQKKRHNVKPGITGLAQVNGRNAILWEEKFKYDIYYVDNRSIFLDVKILYLTFKKVLLRSGISAEGEATMPKFKGNGE